MAGYVHGLAATRRELSALVGGPSEAVTPESGDAIVQRMQLQRTLGDLVLSLAEPLRSTVLLRFYEDLDSTQIAARLGVPASTVRWRLQQGLSGLRDQLDAAHGGDRSAWHLALLPINLSPFPLPPKGLSIMMKLFWLTAVTGTAAVTASLWPRTPTLSIALPPSLRKPVAAASAKPTLDRAARSEFLGRIDSSRAARSSQPAVEPARALDPSYVREQMSSVLPMIEECFEQGLEKDAKLAGKLIVRFTISGEQEIGGLVSRSEIVDEGSTFNDKDVRECIAETLYAMRFPAPANGGESVVTYPFTLEAAD